MPDEAADDVRNEVRLVGRLAAPGEERALPSGDVLVSFRVVVARPPGARAARSPAVDTIDCAAWTGGVRRTVLGWAAGDVVEVTGALRRRFWRAGAGAASRTEVEVLRAKRVAKAPAPP
ncbi:MAG TPA: single-stranded DNA-binding protein [Mycobacteriales bacterium]|nr:single-stranded DNA-binding protein [Mycobacteriales bacterium]